MYKRAKLTASVWNEKTLRYALEVIDRGHGQFGHALSHIVKLSEYDLRAGDRNHPFPICTICTDGWFTVLSSESPTMHSGRIWVLGLMLLMSCWTAVDGFYLPLRLRRVRREEGGGTEGGGGEGGDGGEGAANHGAFALPTSENNHPFPSIGSDSLAPQFPFTHSFSNGLDINRGDITEMTGHLNVPVPGWGMWDLKGHQLFGPTHTWYNYGHFLSPANPYHLGPSSMAQMAQAQSLTDRDSPSTGSSGPAAVPVAQLPTGFVPAQCKPPLCNPFLHTFDMGTQIEPGDEKQYDGSLDFPYQAKDGTVRRFPLSGGFVGGTQPVSVMYGQNMNPVNPFASYDRANRRAMLRDQQQAQHDQRPQSSAIFHDSSSTSSSSSSSGSENSVGGSSDSSSYKPFVLPSSQPDGHHVQSIVNDHFYHGDQGLVVPPALPSRDSVLPSNSMPAFPLLTPRAAGRR